MEFQHGPFSQNLKSSLLDRSVSYLIVHYEPFGSSIFIDNRALSLTAVQPRLDPGMKSGKPCSFIRFNTISTLCPINCWLWFATNGAHELHLTSRCDFSRCLECFDVGNFKTRNSQFYTKISFSQSERGTASLMV